MDGRDRDGRAQERDHLPVLERAEPSGLCSRILRHPRSDRLDDENVGEASHDGLAAGTHVLRFNRHQAERAVDRFQLWGTPGVYRDHAGQQGNESLSHGVIEANGSASDYRRRAASATPENLVPVADLFAWEIEQPRRRHAVSTRQPVTGAVRHERELARLQHVVFASVYFHQALTQRHDVEYQTVVECRQLERPRRREFPPAVQDAGHPQEMQSFAQWINLRQLHPHRCSEYAPESHVRPRTSRASFLETAQESRPWTIN
jgi:hypothetical protein